MELLSWKCTKIWHRFPSLSILHSPISNLQSSSSASSRFSLPARRGKQTNYIPSITVATHLFLSLLLLGKEREKNKKEEERDDHSLDIYVCLRACIIPPFRSVRFGSVPLQGREGEGATGPSLLTLAVYFKFGRITKRNKNKKKSNNNWTFPYLFNSIIS